MEYQFSAHIRASKDGQFYSVLVGGNGQDVFVQEDRKSKSGIKSFVKKWFLGVTIVDETLKSFKKK